MATISIVVVVVVTAVRSDTDQVSVRCGLCVEVGGSFVAGRSESDGLQAVLL